MKDTQNKRKGILKKTAALALAVMTFATSFSCDYAAVGAFAAEVTQDAAENVGEAAKDAANASKKTVKSMTARVGAAKKAKKAAAKKPAVKRAPSNASLATRQAVSSTEPKDNTIDFFGTAGSNTSDVGWSIQFKNAIIVHSSTTTGYDEYRVTYLTSGTTISNFAKNISIKSFKYKEAGNIKTVDDAETLNQMCTVTAADDIGQTEGNGQGSFTIRTEQDFYNTYKNKTSYAPQGLRITVDIKNSVAAKKPATYLQGDGKEHAVTYSGRAYDMATKGYVVEGTAANAFSYTGQPIEPTVAIDDGTGSGNRIQINKANTTYKTGYDAKNNQDASSRAYVTALLPTQPYYGERVKIYFTIEPRSLTDNDETTHSDLTGNGITVSQITDQEYTGKPIKPAITVTDNGLGTTKVLTEAQDKDGNAVTDADDAVKGDYYVTYADNTNKGTATVTIHGVGNYTGTISRTFNITAMDTSKNSQIVVEPIAAQDYTGKAITPKPVIRNKNITSPKNQILKEGEDYTLTYSNNIDMAQAAATNPPTVHIHYIGNYTGDKDVKFAIGAGDILKKGTKVYLYNGLGDATTDDDGWHLAYTVTGEETKGKFTVTTKDDGEYIKVTASSDAFTYFNPTGDNPEIRIVDANNNELADTDFKESKPGKGSKSSEVWGTDVSNGWTTNLTGSGNYKGTSRIRLTFDVKKLPLGDGTLNGNSSHITVTSTDLNNSTGPQVGLTYTSYSGKTKTLTQKSNTNQQNKADYEVTLNGSGENAQARIKALSTSNYTGGFITTGVAGYDLSKAIVSNDKNDGAELHIRLFDPFTGVELTKTSTGFTYYGDNITPAFIIEKKESSGYKQIASSNYTVTLEAAHNKPTDSNSYYDNRTVTISGQGELFNSVRVSYDMVKHSFVKSGTGGNWTTKKSDDIRIDASGITSTTNLDSVKSGLKVYLDPANQGKLLVLRSKNSGSGSGSTQPAGTTTQTGDSTNTPISISDTVEMIAIDDSTSIAAQKAISDSNTIAYWIAPTLQNRTANGVELKQGTDYDVAFTIDETTRLAKGDSIDITGQGNFRNRYTYKFGQQDLSTEDFYVNVDGTDYTENPATIANRNYSGNPILPEVLLYKKATAGTKSPTLLAEGTDYWAEYISPDGVKVDKDGYQVDDNGNHLDKDGNSTTTTTAYEKKDESFKTAGDYRIILRAKSTQDASGSDNSKYFGYRTVDYKIVASDSPLNISLSQTEVPYDGNNTMEIKPSKSNGAIANPTSTLEVTVTDRDNNELTFGTDYTFGTITNAKEPGTKTITVNGINKYQGTTVTATYDVTVDMTELGSEDADKKPDGKIQFKNWDFSGEEQSRTMYYNGGASLTDAAGTNSFSLGSIAIQTITNKSVIRNKDYTVSVDGSLDAESLLYSPGDHTVTFDGIGGFRGSYSIYFHVVVTRSGLLWSDSDANGTSIEIPWTEAGYRLGTGKLSLYKKIGDVATTTTLNSDDVVSVTKDGNNVLGATYNQEFKNIGSYTVKIQGPKPATGSTTLTINILYDLSSMTVDLGPGNTDNAYSGADIYNGNLSQISVYRTSTKNDANKLTYNNDYGIARQYADGRTSSNNFADAGTIDVTLEARAGHSKYFGDTQKYSYTITPLDQDTNYTLDDKNPEQINEAIFTNTYNGTDQKPADDLFTGKVKYNGTTLVLNKDFTVSYSPASTVNAGKYAVIITGIGNYTKSRTFPGAYEIKKYDLSTIAKDKVTIPDQYYNGKAITPQSIKVDGVTGDLAFGSDYTVDNPSNNVNPGTKTAKVDISGAGINFTGKVSEVPFSIKKLDLGTYTPEVSNATYNNGASVDVDSHIKLYIPDGKERIKLTRGSDYTLLFTKDNSTSADDPTNAGTYTVTINATNDSPYVTGTGTVTFVINPLSIKDHESEFNVDNAEWTGQPVEPEVTLNGQPLDSTYTVAYSYNTDACGKERSEMVGYDPNFDENKLPTATITGTGNFTGTIKKHFRIGHPFSDATITPTTNNTLRYNGQEQKREFNITYTVNGQTRTLESARYTVRYPDNITDAGDKVVTFIANGGPLYGTATKTYTIYPVQGSVWSAEFTNLTMDSSGQYVAQYQGAAITPDVRAYVLTSAGQRTEIPLKASEVTYANNTAAGTASVTIKPNNYEGSKVLYFRILGVDISGSDVYAAFTDGITRRKYTGSAITPAVTVTFAGNQGTVTLTKDRDYSLTYTGNTNAGPANVKITGIGNYSGSKSLDFSIWANLNDKTSTFTVPKQMYTGEPITALQGATIKAGGNDLVLGTDYTLEITSTDAYRTKGTAIFTAQGQYYEGTRTVRFDIGNDASMYNVLGVASTYVFDHQAHKPVPVVTDKQGQVYPTNSVTYQNTSDGDTCVNAGNVRMTITITSHGQTVSIPYNYIIEPRNINTATFTPLRDVDYNGKPHTPTVRITEGTRLLTGTSTSSDGSADYVVTYLNNTQPGKAQVVVTGINNYTGVSNLYFSINVKAAPQMIVTAMPSGRLKVTWNKVSGVSGYRIFYTPDGGTQKQVNVSSSKKSTYLTGLTRGVVYTVGVQSYIAANGVNGYSTASVQQIATSTSRPTITSAKSTGRGKIKIKWKKVSNATAYMVYRKTGNGKWSRVKTTKSTSYTNSGLKSGRKYTYKVISYKQSGVKRSFSRYSKGRTVRAK